MFVLSYLSLIGQQIICFAEPLRMTEIERQYGTVRYAVVASKAPTIFRVQQLDFV